MVEYIKGHIYCMIRYNSVIAIIDDSVDNNRINIIFDHSCNHEHTFVDVTNLGYMPAIGTIYKNGEFINSINTINEANELIEQTNKFDTISFQKKYWTLEQEAEFEQFRFALFDVVYENTNIIPKTPDFVNEML